MKRCPDCGESKPLEEFPRNRRTKDGRHVYCKSCNNARSKESRERLHGGSRQYHLKRRYGIGAAEFNSLLVAQGGVCRICGRTGPEYIDHDHDGNQVRGILCFNCNGGLGQFGDDVERLESAIAYLFETAERHRDDRELAELARSRARALVEAGT